MEEIRHLLAIPLLVVADLSLVIGKAVADTCLAAAAYLIGKEL